MYDKLKPYLDKSGLTLADDKTNVSHISEGFDFLGFNLRQYKTNNGMHLLIKPSNTSVKKAGETIRNAFIQGGDKRYDNLELLHKSCQKYHHILLEKYGGGKEP